MQQTTSRRDFIRQMSWASLAAGSKWTGALAGQPEQDPLIIDCHAHIYGEDEVAYPTVEKPYRPPPGTGTVAHLKREMRQSGVSHVTAIQTSTFYRWDNRFTVDAARSNADVMVAVCTLDPDDPRSPEILQRYVRDGGVRGMRSIPAASGRLDDPGVRKLWRTAERLGIVINVLVSRDKREQIETLAGQFPKLRLVIDHCLNLKSGPEMEATLGDMLSLAAIKNIHAKLTFIPTGSAEKYPCRDMHAACHEIIRAFSPRRCVWGSDFPCELWCPSISYAQHLRIFTHELGLDESHKQAILGKTAWELWFRGNGSGD